MTRTAPVAIETIVSRLTDEIVALAQTLLPMGRMHGHEWRVGSVAGEPGDSLGVHLYGAKAGVWADFSTADHNGDALDLVRFVLFNGDKGEAIRWARDWLGLDGDTSGEAAAEARRKGAAAREQRREQASAEAVETRDNAVGIWLKGQVKILGTPVDRYLQGRGIQLARFAGLGRLPGALRFHPSLWNGETGGRHWPAMVAIVHDTGGKPCAVHRTWLSDAGDGRVVKLPVANPKMTLGRYAGGCIRIWRGQSGKPLKDAPAGEPVVVTEGIEDALTIAQAMPERRVLCAIALANVANLVLPAQAGPLTIVADNDGAGSAGELALWKAVKAQRARGVKVLVAHPPAWVKDVNELWVKSVNPATPAATPTLALRVPEGAA